MGTRNQAARTTGQSRANRGATALVVRGLSLAVAIQLLLLCSPANAAPDLADPDVAVQAARDGLDSYWGKNWYDDQGDAFAAIDLPVQRKRTWSFFAWLFSLFSGWTFDLAGFLKLLSWLALFALLVAIIYVVVKAAKNAELESAERVDDPDDGRSHIERVEALPVSLERTSGDFLSEAKNLLAAGELTLAVVYLFSYQLVELDKRRLLRLVKGKTNRQYLRELRRNAPDQPRVASLVEQTTLIFERAFFGAHPPEVAKLETCFASVNELLSLADLASKEHRNG